MKELIIFGVEIPAAIYAPVLYFLWVSVFLILKKIVYSKVRAFARKTSTGLDDILLKSMDLPLVLLIFTSGAFVLENILDFGSDSELLAFVDITFKATAILAIIIFIDRLLRALVDYYSTKVSFLKASQGIVHTVVRVVVMGLGILILLDSFGVSITPILASLGVGSIALALALQPTLENVFSGIQLIAAKPLAIGHFIRLESGEEGYVQKIGWRSTWIKTFADYDVIVPNKMLVDSRIINYHYPTEEMLVFLTVGVHYDSDLDHVEKVTIEVAEDVMKTVEGAVSEFTPFIRYRDFNDSSIDLRVALRVKEFLMGGRVKHAFIKRLHKRYREEGIVIPYPIRTLEGTVKNT